MNYTETAQQICNKIVETAYKLDDSRRFSTSLELDIYLNEPYTAIAIEPDRRAYGIGSRPEDYIGDAEYEETVQVEDIAFPCTSFIVNNGIAVFKCVDPVDKAIDKHMSIGHIAQMIENAGIESIQKAVVSIGIGNKTLIAGVSSCEYCDTTNVKFANGKNAINLSYLELDRHIDLNYTPVIGNLAQEQHDDAKRYSESMNALGKRYFGEDENKFHEYHISYCTSRNANRVKSIDIEASSAEDAVKSFNEKISNEFPEQKVTKIINMTCDGKPVRKKILDELNSSYLDECDGAGAGAAASGDAGAAVPAGDAGASAVDAQTGDSAAEMVGTTTADVLGKCEPGKGYMGKDNFYIPARAKVPLHRWEAANGGSKRKKKNKKYAYEKGAKVVVSMFEDEQHADEDDEENRKAQ